VSAKLQLLIVGREKRSSLLATLGGSKKPQRLSQGTNFLIRMFRYKLKERERVKGEACPGASEDFLGNEIKEMDFIPSFGSTQEQAMTGLPAN